VIDFLSFPVFIGASFLLSHSKRMADSFSRFSLAAIKSFSPNFFSFLVTSLSHLISIFKLIFLLNI
jgi:hypothetical protein